MYFIFFDNVGGGKVLEDFRKVIQLKKIKMVILVFVVDILQLPHTVILYSEKLTHPTVQ